MAEDCFVCNNHKAMGKQGVWITRKNSADDGSNEHLAKADNVMLAENEDEQTIEASRRSENAKKTD